jgi:hypothetical protein
LVQELDGLVVVAPVVGDQDMEQVLAALEVLVAVVQVDKLQ